MILVDALALHRSDDEFASRSPPPSSKEYRETAELLEEVPPEGEVVVAPWDVFPELPALSRHNRYAAGI